MKERGTPVGGIDCGGCGDGSWGGDEGDDSVESTAGADEEAAAAAWQQSGRDPNLRQYKSGAQTLWPRCRTCRVRTSTAGDLSMCDRCDQARACHGGHASSPPPSILRARRLWHGSRRSCSPSLACHSSARCQRAAM